jgi:DNA repair protein RecN (Recombination protein N)
MLTHLYIKNFTIIDTVALELTEGLTVLTGETGAGKSIMLDALQIVLGDRAESRHIKIGETRCEVTATFAIENNAPAQTWLKAQEMDEGKECIIRRVLTQDGRSRTTINMRPCTLQTVRELGSVLVHIHGQNQHQQLLKNAYQCEILDGYAQNAVLCDAIEKTYAQWKKVVEELHALRATDTAQQADFLAFQLRELSELALQENELSTLTEAHQQLAHAEQWMAENQQALDILADHEEHNVLQYLYKTESLLQHAPATTELLQQARIQTEEAISQIRHALKKLEADPTRMQAIEQRLASIHTLARKHRVAPEQLYALQQDLHAQHQALDQKAERIPALEEKIGQLETEYRQHAAQLTQRRHVAAKKLGEKVTAHLHTLGMPQGRIEIQLIPRDTEQLHMQGQEQIAFLVTAQPDQPCYPLHKVASGGELSRIALAIQVVTSTETILPTLIFDEVDVGIGGGVAEIVGKQLKHLGQHAQILCITHLPQVAAQGQQHLHVQKNIQAGKTTTGIRLLSQAEKIQEIARMLGGLTITEKTLAHAQEMLEA